MSEGNLKNLISRCKSLSEQNLDQIIAVRRAIHAYPELAFEEVETSKRIQNELHSAGIEFEANIARTGIVATIKGELPGEQCVALRADMDALPIQEANEVSYKSRRPGLMHACGHDAHSSSLVGATLILNELKPFFGGTVKLIFQPSEEKLPGGAKQMIAEGVLEQPHVQSIFGQHVEPFLPVGTIGYKPGAFMASADEIYLKVKGKGGHAAMPHELIDPVVICAQIITALQQLVSRKSSPFSPMVLSFGKLKADGATNIIPNDVFIEGTLRVLNEDLRYKAHSWIKDTASGIATAMGGNCEVDIKVGYPFVKNDELLCKRMYEQAVAYLGSNKIIEMPTRMGAEDFAYYSQQIPACFYRLGVMNEKKFKASGLHTPTFNIDEDALVIGMGFMAWNAIAELGA